MNEPKAQSKETSHASTLGLAKARKDALGRRAWGPDRDHVSGCRTSPRLALRRARGSAPHPPRQPLRALLTCSPPEAPAPRGGSAGGRKPAAAATPEPQPLESLLRVRPSRAAVPRGKLLPGPRPRPPPPGRSRQRRSTGGARAAPCALGGESPPQLAGPGAAPAVYRGRGPLSPPAPSALLTSFILSPPRPPPPFQAVTHRGRGRRRGLPPRWPQALSGARQTGATS